MSDSDEEELEEAMGAVAIAPVEEGKEEVLHHWRGRKKCKKCRWYNEEAKAGRRPILARKEGTNAYERVDNLYHINHTAKSGFCENKNRFGKYVPIGYYETMLTEKNELQTAYDELDENFHLLGLQYTTLKTECDELKEKLNKLDVKKEEH